MKVEQKKILAQYICTFLQSYISTYIFIFHIHVDAVYTLFSYKQKCVIHKRLVSVYCRLPVCLAIAGCICQELGGSLDTCGPRLYMH